MNTLSGLTSGSGVSSDRVADSWIDNLGYSVKRSDVTGKRFELELGENKAM